MQCIYLFWNESFKDGFSSNFMDDFWERSTDLICVYRTSSKVVSLSRSDFMCKPRSDFMCKTQITTKQFMQAWLSLWGTPFYKTINIYYQKNIKEYMFGRRTYYFLEFDCKSVVVLSSSICLIQLMVLRCWPPVYLLRQYCRCRNIACHCATKGEGDRKSCIYFQGGMPKEQFLLPEHTSRDIFRICHYRSYLTAIQK